MTWKQTLTFALVLGFTAAAVVWYLERFEVAKLHTELSEYLANHDRFKKWEADQHGGDFAE